MARLALQLGANIEARTSVGNTPFLSAVQNGDINTMLCLLDSGANVHARTNDGSTALHIAVSNGNEAALVFLLERGDIDVNATSDIMKVGFRYIYPPSVICLLTSH